jgi:hypothetical protein
LNAQQSPAPAKPAAQSRGLDRNELIFGGGALALLILGVAAYAMSRRRRHEEEWVEEPTTELEPVNTPVAATEPAHEPAIHDEQPAMVAPSAFTWGREEPAAQKGETNSDDDRLPGESWVERAYRGPSAGNPSVSLKNRLRRAAFFDKRERDVAAGIAEPVDMDAGLPEAMADEQESEVA